MIMNDFITYHKIKQDIMKKTECSENEANIIMNMLSFAEYLKLYYMLPEEKTCQ
jgi:hypothetical protein